MDNCEYWLSEWMLESVKEFEEEARWKTPRERGTVDIVKRSQWLLAGALNEYDTGEKGTDEDIMG